MTKINLFIYLIRIKVANQNMDLYSAIAYIFMLLVCFGGTFELRVGLALRLSLKQMLLHILQLCYGTSLIGQFIQNPIFIFVISWKRYACIQSKFKINLIWLNTIDLLGSMLVRLMLTFILVACSADSQLYNLENTSIRLMAQSSFSYGSHLNQIGSSIAILIGIWVGSDILLACYMICRTPKSLIQNIQGPIFQRQIRFKYSICCSRIEFGSNQCLFQVQPMNHPIYIIQGILHPNINYDECECFQSCQFCPGATYTAKISKYGKLTGPQGRVFVCCCFLFPVTLISCFMFNHIQWKKYFCVRCGWNKLIISSLILGVGGSLRM